MRKFLVAVAVAGLVIASLGGSAYANKKAKGRTATLEYDKPNAFWVGPFDVSVYTNGFADFMTFKTKRSERNVSFSVEDASGMPVSGAVFQKGERVGRFCGAGDVKLPGGKYIIVTLYTGTCEDNSPSVVTEGTIMATFTGHHHH